MIGLGSLLPLLEDNKQSKNSPTIDLDNIKVLDNENDLGLMNLLDDISIKSTCLLKIDGIQTMSWNSIMSEETLVLPLHVCKTSKDLQLSSNVEMHLLRFLDLYHEVTNPIHIQPSNWKLSILKEGPKLIKEGSHLRKKNCENYWSLISKYQDVCERFYLNLRSIYYDITKYTTTIFTGAIFVQQRKGCG